MSPYHVAVNEENEKYDNTYDNITTYVEERKDTLDYLEESLSREMQANGIISVYSSSYYEQKIDSSIDKINKKNSDIAYYSADTSGKYTSKINSLRAEIASLQSEISDLNVCYMYAQRKEQIRDDRSAIEKEGAALKQEAYKAHTDRLEALQNAYAFWNNLYELGHMNSDDTWATEVAPTCTEEGSAAYRCDYCDFYLSKPISELGHNLSVPNCTNASKCSRCTYSEGKPLGHDWMEATCTTDKICRTCSVIGDVSALGHDYIHHDDKPATCIAEGWNEYDTCSRCTYSTYSSTLPLGHNMLVKSEMDATIAENGFCETYCSRCTHTNYEIRYAIGTPGLTFTSCSSGYSVSLGNCLEKIIYIPEFKNGIPVVEINNFANSNIEEIHIPSSIKNINLQAFINCPNLKAIDVSTDNTVFSSKGACLIDISEKTLIAGCQNSKIPSDGSVTVISQYAFVGASNMKELIIPNAIRSIESGVFSGCSNLEKLTIPFPAISELKTTCNVQAFGRLFGNTQYDNSVKVEQRSLKISCVGQTVYLNEGYSYTYYMPKSFKSIVVSAGELYSYSLENCSTIQSLTVGENVSAFYSSAINNCINLQSVYVNNPSLPISGDTFASYGNDLFSEYDNAFYLGSEDNPYMILISAKNKSITSCVIHPKTISIANNAFSNCSNLTSVTLSDCVTNIGNYAFYQCANLAHIKFRGSKNQWNAISKGTMWNEYFKWHTTPNTGGAYYTADYVLTCNYTGD